MKYKVVLSPYKSHCPILKVDDGKPCINSKNTIYYQIHIISMDEIEYPSDWGYSIIYHHTLPATSGAGSEKIKDLYDHGWRRIVASTDSKINNGNWKTVPILTKEFIQYYCELGGLDEIESEELEKWIDTKNIENNPKNNYHNEAHYTFTRHSSGGFEDGIDLNSLAISIALKHEIESFCHWLRNIDDGEHFYDPNILIYDFKKSIGFSPFDEFKKGTPVSSLFENWLKYRNKKLETDHGSRIIQHLKRKK